MNVATVAMIANAITGAVPAVTQTVFTGRQPAVVRGDGLSAFVLSFAAGMVTVWAAYAVYAGMWVTFAADVVILGAMFTQIVLVGNRVMITQTVIWVTAAVSGVVVATITGSWVPFTTVIVTVGSVHQIVRLVRTAKMGSLAGVSLGSMITEVVASGSWTLAGLFMWNTAVIVAGGIWFTVGVFILIKKAREFHARAAA